MGRPFTATGAAPKRDKQAGWTERNNGGTSSYVLELDSLILQIWPTPWNGMTWWLKVSPNIIFDKSGLALKAKTLKDAREEALSVVKVRLVSMLTEVTWA